MVVVVDCGGDCGILVVLMIMLMVVRVKSFSNYLKSMNI